MQKFLQYCTLELGLSNNTLAAYRVDLHGFCEFLNQNSLIYPEDISNSAIEDFCVSLQKKSIAGRSIQRKISAINSFVKFLCEEEIIPVNPITDIQKPKILQKLPHFLTKEEINKLISCSQEQNSDEGARNTCIILLLFASGMRISELVNLPISAITYSNSQIQPIIRVIGKGNKERIVPISTLAIEILGKYLEIRHKWIISGKNEKWLFPSRKGGNISRVFVGLMLKNLARMANIPEEKVHPHAFRHSIALQLVNGGMDIRLVQEILGHSDISTTAIYTQVNPQEMINLVEKFHPMAH